MNSAIKISLAVIVSILIFGGPAYIRTLGNGDTSADLPNNLLLTEQTFLTYCVQGATTGADGINADAATTYCKCVFQTGLTQYGAVEWNRQIVELGQTNTLTDGMNAIVNQCVQDIAPMIGGAQ